MGVLFIDSDSSTEELVITGDVPALFANRRAYRFLKDNTTYIQKEDSLIVSIKDSLSKSIDRIKIVADYIKCEVRLSQSANDGIKEYLREENKFALFSQEAKNIRNNECDIEAFKDFKDALIDYLPTRTLYPLQLLSAYHLAFSQNACNFSVPGAGKTSIVYGAYAYLKHLSEDNLKKVDRLLIICPLNAFSPWELEYAECFGFKPTVKRLVGTLSLDAKKQYFYDNSPAEITLLSYSSVVSLVSEIQSFLRRHRVMVVLDEAHKIKNTDGGITAHSIMSISEKCSARVVLTGTPAPNGYEDLYNLFKFIWPTKNVIRYQIGQLKDMSKNVNDERVKQLLDEIEPYYIRIKKSDLGIPEPVIHPPITVPMGEVQRRIYDYIEQKYVTEIAESKDQSFRNVLVHARLIRLMQAATNPTLLLQPLSEFAFLEGFNLSDIGEDSVVLNEIYRYAEMEIPSKYIAVKKLILDILQRGEKVIVWACYIKNIELLQEYLKSQGIESRTLYGATPIAGDDIHEDDEEYDLTREAIVKEFHSPNSSFRVIIANPFAVAESISLHKVCHNAIYMERSFNAAHFIQSKDRIHRYGLRAGTETNYYFLQSENSIDITIHQRLDEKEKRLLEIIESAPIPLFNNVTDDGDSDVKAVLRDYAHRIKKV